MEDLEGLVIADALVIPSTAVAEARVVAAACVSHWNVNCRTPNGHACESEFHAHPFAIAITCALVVMRDNCAMTIPSACVEFSLSMSVSAWAAAVAQAARFQAWQRRSV